MWKLNHKLKVLRGLPWSSVIASLALILTIVLHIQLLPLQRANLIMAEPQAVERSDDILLELSLQNRGKAAARNIQYTVYLFEKNSSDKCRYRGERKNPILDNALVNNIAPDASQRLPYTLFRKPGKLEIYYSVLLARLQYDDDLYFIPQKNIQWTGWTFGVADDKVKKIISSTSLSKRDLSDYQECLESYKIKLF